MRDHFKLYYFNRRGLAEPIRMILAYAEADWEDIRFFEIPADVKSRSSYGQVPLLEFNGQIISQSQTITRFVARKFNLAGRNELESAKCDEIGDAVKDFALLWKVIAHEKDANKKAEGIKKATQDSKTRFLSKFNDLLKANGSNGHFVGDTLTWADIYASCFIDNVHKKTGIQITEEFEEVQKLLSVVFNEPFIKRWIKERPETPS